MGCPVLSLFDHADEVTHEVATAPLRAKHLSRTSRLLSAHELNALVESLGVSNTIVARWAGGVSRTLVCAWRSGKTPVAPMRAEMLLRGAAAYRAARGIR